MLEAEKPVVEEGVKIGDTVNIIGASDKGKSVIAQEPAQEEPLSVTVQPEAFAKPGDTARDSLRGMGTPEEWISFIVDNIISGKLKGLKLDE